MKTPNEKHQNAISPSAAFVEQNKEQLISIWEKRARSEIYSTDGSAHLRDHLCELLEDLTKSLNHSSVSQKPRESSEVFFIQSKSKELGESRLIASDAYRVDEVLEEYVILRQVLTDELARRDLDDLDSVETINRMFELASLSAVKSFAEKSEEMGQRVISTLVHDIRSPLGVAISALEILKNFIQEEELGKEMYLMIERSLQRTLETITNSLDDFSTKSHSKLSLEFKETNLSKTFQSVLNDLEQVYGARLQLGPYDENIIGIFAPSILVRVLENLISNAFKFGNSETPVKISLLQKNNKIELSVHNWGNPISQKNQNDIFNIFHSSSKSGESRLVGWGLGLCHIHLAAKAHGGEVMLSSSEEHGTEFKMILLKDFQEIGKKKFDL